MKKFVILGLVALGTFTLTGCGTGVDVVDYNDKLVDLQNSCYNAESVMMDAWDAENYGVVKELYPTALEACTQSQNAIIAMEAYNEDSSLKDAFLSEMQLEVAYLQKIGEILTYWEYEELTDEQQTAEDALWNELEGIEGQLTTAYTESVTVQEVFATKHGYELEE